jgi:hypothetical protein
MDGRVTVDRGVLNMTSQDTRCRLPVKGDAALQRLADIAAARGMTLLSTLWQGQHAAYLLACPKGHRFTRQGANMRHRTSSKPDTIHRR